MEHHREPIKHTCPDIDKVLFAFNKIQKICNSRHLTNSEELQDFKDAISDVESELWGLDDILERLRNSNDILRIWAIEEAREVDSLIEQKEVI